MGWEQIEGWFSVYDAEFVSNICRNINNGIVVELGCYAGKSTAVMAPICKDKKSVYHAVDNFCGADPTDPATRNQRSRNMRAVFLANMRQMNLIDYVHLHKMDSAVSAVVFYDGSVDFCFVDASHVPEDVLRDIEAWWPKIKSGGILGGHDYQWPGVRQVVNDFVEINGLTLSLSRDSQCWKVTK